MYRFSIAQFKKSGFFSDNRYFDLISIVKKEVAYSDLKDQLKVFKDYMWHVQTHDNFDHVTKTVSNMLLMGNEINHKMSYDDLLPEWQKWVSEQ